MCPCGAVLVVASYVPFWKGFSDSTNGRVLVVSRYVPF
jgi:hypothetical protein